MDLHLYALLMRHLNRFSFEGLWSSTKTYRKFDIVNTPEGTVIYISMKDQNKEPLQNKEAWRVLVSVDEANEMAGEAIEAVREIGEIVKKQGEQAELHGNEAKEVAEEVKKQLDTISETLEETKVINEEFKKNLDKAVEEVDKLEDDRIKFDEIVEKASKQSEELDRIVAEGEERLEILEATKHVGTYKHGTLYKEGNEVEYNGSTFRAMTDVKEVYPSAESEQWQLIAQRGVDGEGAVATVNDVLPDEEGNVKLDGYNNDDILNIGELTVKDYLDGNYPVGMCRFSTTNNVIMAEWLEHIYLYTNEKDITADRKPLMLNGTIEKSAKDLLGFVYMEVLFGNGDMFSYTIAGATAFVDRKFYGSSGQKVNTVEGISPSTNDGNVSLGSITANQLEEIKDGSNQFVSPRLMDELLNTLTVSGKGINDDYNFDINIGDLTTDSYLPPTAKPSEYPVGTTSFRTNMEQSKEWREYLDDGVSTTRYLVYTIKSSERWQSFQFIVLVDGYADTGNTIRHRRIYVRSSMASTVSDANDWSEPTRLLDSNDSNYIEPPEDFDVPLKNYPGGTSVTVVSVPKENQGSLPRRVGSIMTTHPYTPEKSSYGYTGTQLFFENGFTLNQTGVYIRHYHEIGFEEGWTEWRKVVDSGSISNRTDSDSTVKVASSKAVKYLNDALIETDDSLRSHKMDIGDSTNRGHVYVIDDTDSNMSSLSGYASSPLAVNEVRKIAEQALQSGNNVKKHVVGSLLSADEDSPITNDSKWEELLPILDEILEGGNTLEVKRSIGYVVLEVMGVDTEGTIYDNAEIASVFDERFNGDESFHPYTALSKTFSQLFTAGIVDALPSNESDLKEASVSKMITDFNVTYEQHIRMARKKVNDIVGYLAVENDDFMDIYIATLAEGIIDDLADTHSGIEEAVTDFGKLVALSFDVMGGGDKETARQFENGRFDRLTGTLQGRPCVRVEDMNEYDVVVAVQNGMTGTGDYCAVSIFIGREITPFYNSMAFAMNFRGNSSTTTIETFKDGNDLDNDKIPLTNSFNGSGGDREWFTVYKFKL